MDFVLVVGTRNTPILELRDKFINGILQFLAQLDVRDEGLDAGIDGGIAARPLRNSWRRRQVRFFLWRCHWISLETCLSDNSVKIWYSFENERWDLALRSWRESNIYISKYFVRKSLWHICCTARSLDWFIHKNMQHTFDKSINQFKELQRISWSWPHKHWTKSLTSASDEF